MTHDTRFIGDTPQRLIDKARALADDIERIVAGVAPTDAELAAAPLIDHWSPAFIERPILIGGLTGHPLLGDATFARTTDLYAIDAHGRWARTWSRYYRLGRPAVTRGRDQ